MTETTPDPPAGGILSLAGLENLSSSEKSARIVALVNDIYASIVLIAKHTKAGTLTKRHCKPIYDLIESIMVLEKKQKRELKRQDRRMERMARRHQRDIGKLMEMARSGIVHLRAKAERLQMELDELKGRKKIDLEHVEKRMAAKGIGSNPVVSEEAAEQLAGPRSCNENEQSRD
ncbi:hypothetical protein PRK78_007502 [Emydomyces testavorans]|uniref:Uncharacterized protein n=1 Tax=Emydomyces testavorans TaxID=2070801 RepID=A0AAF0DQE0_9EURO|nr:hypothetical protein PRK78_007502 [Emydomyces testavorans]